MTTTGSSATDTSSTGAPSRVETGCCADPTPSGRAHIDCLRFALDAFDSCVDVAESWGTQLAQTLLDGGRLLAAGNGGSAAQAQHLTAELVGRYRTERRPFSAVCLTAETSTLTAIANDYPIDELYARQVEAHGRPGDVLVLLSTSGRSPNAVAAARRGKEIGLRVWAITGPAPNPLADAAEESLCVDSPYTATVQELHLVALHLLCAGLDRALGVDAATVTSGEQVVMAPDRRIDLDADSLATLEEATVTGRKPA